MPEHLVSPLGALVQESGDGSQSPDVFIQPGGYTCLFPPTDYREAERLPDGGMHDITVLGRVNEVRDVNAYFRTIHAKLTPGGYYIGCAETSAQRRNRILREYPRWIAWLYLFSCFVVSYLLARFEAVRHWLASLPIERGQVLSQTELLGRLVFCGFEIVDYQEVGDEFFYVARKAAPPEASREPSRGLIFKMRRVGQHGRIIHVYKLRTMYPYSEYLQQHVYERNRLSRNGKLAGDFRVTPWGRQLRRLWIDELPMLVNLCKGELKLVGVRPLSRHYMSLYPERLVEKRLRHRPGLVPPFYVDLPESFDEILQSEERYLDACERAPFRTDLYYLYRALYNILIRRARSA